MARFQIAPGPVPLHHQVYQDLRAALDDREWAVGDRLPTERELARRYGCSLITVRRALDELRREHRLTRTQGRGTFVSQPAIERDHGLAQALKQGIAGVCELHALGAAVRRIARALHQPGSLHAMQVMRDRGAFEPDSARQLALHALRLGLERDQQLPQRQ